MMPTQQIEADQKPSTPRIVERSVGALLLDSENPRLAIEARTSQTAILERLYIDEALEELAVSLVRNGYFWEEPLVVVPSPGDKDTFVVVEGNRRLAALKLLLSPALRKKLSVANFPDAPASRLNELKEVPTVMYPSRDRIVPYLGFRHITGVKKWEPYAKARYIDGLLRAGVTIEQIEDSIGDNARTVRKLYQSYLVFRQIEDDLDLDTKEVRSNFSILEVLLGQQAVKELLGVPRQLPRERAESVVPTERLSELREVISWAYGDQKTGELRVISDSRQIPKRLAPVIANKQALEYLRKTRDLEAAYERSGGERLYYLKQLTAASRAIERALGVAPLYKNDEEILTQVDRLVTQIQSLAREARR